MIFKLHFFKEETRLFDKADLFEYISSNNYVTFDSETRESEKIAYYDNQDLDLNARFIFSEKSQINDIHKISPNFYDVNITFEIELLYPEYKLNKLLNIVEVMCKRYNFYVYNLLFNNALNFRRQSILIAYQKLKQGYKEKNEEEFMNYAKLSLEDLNKVYSYLEVKDTLEKNYIETNAIALNYEFYKRPGSRNAFLAARWDGAEPFIIPSNVQIFIYDDGVIKKSIKFDELVKNIKHSLIILDDASFGVYMLNPKYTKKIKKHIIKFKYIEMQVNLKEVDLKNILDL